MEDHADDYARNLSGGMRRRLLMAKSLVHQPPIVFLDEPTAGVDLHLRKNLWNNVKKLNSEGVTVILTTHYLEEAEKISDRIGILNKGKLVALDTTENLLNQLQMKKVEFKYSGKLSNKINFPQGIKILSKKDNSLTISYNKKMVSMDLLINEIKKDNVEILDIFTDDGDLEDIFEKLTKN